MKKLLLLGSIIGFSFAVNVRVIANNVDDIAEIFIDGRKVAECQWKYHNCYAGKTLDLQGKHEIRFRLTNLVYRGPCLFGPCGKFNVDFAVAVNNKIIWSNSIYVRDNSEGVKYDKILICNFKDSKSYCIEKN